VCSRCEEALAALGLFWWGRLQPVLLRSVGARSCESQDRQDCGGATAHRQECLCHWKAMLLHSGCEETLSGVGLTSVGARHAVPGERTWRGGAICRDVGLSWSVYRRPPAGVFEFRCRGEVQRQRRRPEASSTNGKVKRAGETPAVQKPLPEISFCGECVAACQASRSGTACRAPTVGNGEGTIPRVAPSIGSCGALLRWHRRRFHDRLTGGACATERRLLDYYCGLAAGDCCG
jgi:hypothetical protein